MEGSLGRRCTKLDFDEEKPTQGPTLRFVKVAYLMNKKRDIRSTDDVIDGVSSVEHPHMSYLLLVDRFCHLITYSSISYGDRDGDSVAPWNGFTDGKCLEVKRNRCLTPPTYPTRPR